MKKRRTCLVFDEEGRPFIAIIGKHPDIHNDTDMVKLYIEENRIYGECEVKTL